MTVYDAFISYSHAKDKPIAAALQSVVQKLGKPWYRRRALRVFRDDTSLSATPHLWPSIEAALAQSRYLILLASPEAARSPWIAKEVDYWLMHRSPDTLFIGLTAGELAWDQNAGDFQWSADTPLPQALKGRFTAEPRWVDLHAFREGADPRSEQLRELGADFAAAIHGMPKEDLLSQEVRQQRRALALAWSSAGTLAVLLGLAVWLWREAVWQRDLALSRSLVNESNNKLDTEPDIAMLLSLEALKIRETPDTQASLLAALQSEPALVTYLRGHLAPVSSVIITPDGRTAISGDENGLILFWDLESQKQIPPSMRQTDSVTALAVSPDGLTLASGTNGKGVLLWDISKHKQMGDPLSSDSHIVNSVAFSPKGSLLASGSSDGKVDLWEPKHRTLVGSLLDAELRAIVQVAFSRDGEWLAVAGQDGMRLLEVATQVWKDTIRTNHAVKAITFAPDGKTLALAQSDGAINIQNIASGASYSLPAQAVEPQAVAFVAKGAVFIAGFADGLLRRWDLRTREPITPPWRASPASIRDLAVRLDDGKFVTGNQDSTIILWDADRGDALSTALPQEHVGGVSDLIFTGVGHDLMSGGYDKTVDLWDAKKKRVRTLVRTHPATIQSLAVSPDRRLFAFRDGKKLVTIGSFAEIQSTGQSLEGLRALSNLAFADGGKTLLFGVDNGILFWDVDRRSVEMVVHTKAPIISIATADAANLVAAADRDGTITLVDSRTRQSKGKTIRHEGNIPSLALSPDGELLAAAGENGSIMVWRVSDTKLAWSEQLAHGQEAIVVAFGGTGSTLASGGADGRIKLWDAASGQSLGWLGNKGGGESVDALDFSPDGSLLASGGQDGRIKLWDLGLADWKNQACRITRRDITPEEANLYFGDRRQGFCASQLNRSDHNFTDKP